MPLLRDFLSRLRPAGTPGAALAAVPAEPGRRMGAELAPVLMLLDGVDTECARQIAAAQRDAEQITAAAQAKAEALAAKAQQRAAAVRQETVQQILASARAEADATTAGAAQQAAQMRELSRQRLPGLAQRAVALIRDLPGADGQALPAAAGLIPQPGREARHECRVGRRVCPGQGHGPEPLGPDAARRLAASPSLSAAQQVLAAISDARAARVGETLEATQHAVAAELLWNLRVLAGWLPRDGVDLLRALACWFEIANVDELLESAAGRPAEEEFRLGALATAWPRLRRAGSLSALRAALAASRWHDPGGDTALDIRLGLRARWTARVAGFGDPARTWASGAAALLLAGERFAAARPVRPAVMDGALALTGQAAASAATLDDLHRSLPAAARWALSGISSPDGLWQAEAAWWTRVERDGFALLRTSATDSGTVLGAAAVMAADARRVCAALEIATRGGGPLEAYDAVA